jgi:hypothetical protein
MGGIPLSVLGNVIAVPVITFLVFIWYNSIELYQIFTKKDFSNVHMYLVHFTRNDHKSSTNTIHLNQIDYKVSLRDIYKSRLLAWRVIYTSRKATPTHRVLDFKQSAHMFLAPIRGWILRSRMDSELRRAAGFPFKRIHYQVVMIYDQSDDQKNYVVKILLITQKDLDNFREYLEDPPRASNNLALMQEIVNAYEQKTGSFLPMRIIIA